MNLKLYSAMTKKLHKTRQQCGSTAVEFALILPILLLILDGAMELGFIVHNQSVLTTASSLAARAGSALSTPKLLNSEIATIASDYCVGKLLNFSGAPVVSTVITQSADPVFQKPLQVVVHFTYSGLLIGGNFSVFPINPELSASTVMFNE